MCQLQFAVNGVPGVSFASIRAYVRSMVRLEVSGSFPRHGFDVFDVFPPPSHLHKPFALLHRLGYHLLPNREEK